MFAPRATGPSRLLTLSFWMNTGKVIGKHFAGPTWQLTDGSEIKGKLMASQAAA